MKRLQLLQIVTTLLFLIALLALFFAVPFILVTAVMPDQVPFNINGQPAKAAGAEVIMLMLTIAAGFALFTYALYLFKKTLSLFEKGKWLDSAVIINLDRTGWAILTGYLVGVGPLFLYNTITRSTIDLEISFGFGSAPVVLGLSLFFMVLSDVFRTAKKAEAEDNPTI